MQRREPERLYLTLTLTLTLKATKVQRCALTTPCRKWKIRFRFRNCKPALCRFGLIHATLMAIPIRFRRFNLIRFGLIHACAGFFESFRLMSCLLNKPFLLYGVNRPLAISLLSFVSWAFELALKGGSCRLSPSSCPWTYQLGHGYWRPRCSNVGERWISFRWQV